MINIHEIIDDHYDKSIFLSIIMIIYLSHIDDDKYGLIIDDDQSWFLIHIPHLPRKIEAYHWWPLMTIFGRKISLNLTSSPELF